MKKDTIAFAMILALPLAGCGGGGGAVNSTPVPPPPPPPSGNNASLLSLDYSQSFTNDAASGSVNVPLGGGTETVNAQATVVTAAYDATSKSYTITAGGKTQKFSPTDIDKGNSNFAVTVYNKVNGSTVDTLTLTNPGTSGHFTYQYVGSGYWQETKQTPSDISGSLDAFTYGITTPDANLPRTGAAQYAIDVLAEVSHMNSVSAVAGTGTLGVDFQSGNILGKASLPAVIFPGADDTVTIAAKLSGVTNSFSGNITWDDFGTFKGTINGRFYGPNAQEVGAAFSAPQNGVSTIAVGTIVGRGNAPTAVDPNASNPASSPFFYADTAGYTTTETGNDGWNAFYGMNVGGFSNGKTTIGKQEYYSAGGYIPISGSTLPSAQPMLIGAKSNGAQQVESFSYGSGSTGAMPDLSYVSAGMIYQPNSSVSFSIFGNDAVASAMPRTGSAGYVIVASVLIADPAYPNTINGSGAGTMRADFATGLISGSGGLDYRENYSIAPPAPQPPFPPAKGAFTFTGSNTSGSNGFSGTMSFDGVGPYSGPLAGRYYGPAAQEVGAVFSATAGNGGVAAGEFIGVNDPAITAAEVGLQQLSAPTSFKMNAEYYGASSSINWSKDSEATLNYDPATGTYTFVSGPNIGFSQAMKFGPGNLDADHSNSSVSVYNSSDSTQTSQVTLFNPGASNPTLALTYVSFANIRSSIPNGSGWVNHVEYYAPFGVVTPAVSVPKTGTASYSGIIYGSATQVSAGGATSQYALSGSSTLAVDFGASTLAATLNFTGTPTGGGAGTSLGSVTMNGTLGKDAAGNSSFSASAYGGSTPETFNNGNLQGAFYGPAANEFGFSFANTQGVSGGSPRIQAQGVSVGKKN